MAGRQDSADQQNMCFPPGSSIEEYRERVEQGYNGIGQGKHDLAFPVSWTLLAYPVLLV